MNGGGSVKRRVVVRIAFGLGNQMLEYAAADKLAGEGRQTEGGDGSSDTLFLSGVPTLLEQLPSRSRLRELFRFDSPVEDLRRMSRCCHHVLSNSTFSWWGACLAADGGERVFPPGELGVPREFPT